MDIQQNIMNSIAHIAKENGYQVINNSEWANLGKVSISPVGTLASTIGFAYNFQSNYVSIQLYKGGVQIVGGMVSKTQPGLIADYYISIHEGRRLDAMLADFRKHLPKIATPKKKAVKNIDKDTLVNISRQFQGIEIRDLTTCEAKIAKLLERAAYLRRDGEVYLMIEGEVLA